jgi:predicted dehydrogenase
MELVALCDTWDERLLPVGEALGVATYTDYDEFLAHDMDAVILANWFHQHAPFAIAALRAGKHVLSETTACITLAEGVQLVEEVERTGLVYMLAENYPYMVFNQEMRRLYEAGEVGELRYAEAEYVHPFSADGFNNIAPGVDHWRNWLPLIYYSTHALAPVLSITNRMPTRVNGFVVPYDHDDPAHTMTARRNDAAGAIMLQMDNGAVVKLLQGTLRGEGVWVRVHGNKGLMENLRVGNSNSVRLKKEPWDTPDGTPVERVYTPPFPTHDAEARATGHGGGDFFVNLHFADAIRSGRQPFFNVHRAVTMSAVGILAYRSALEGSTPQAVPDFRDPAARGAVANDDWGLPNGAPGHAPSSVLGDIKPSPEAIERAERVWANQDDLLHGWLVKALMERKAAATDSS